MSKKITPMMAQYNRFKAEHPDCIVLFRLGDFYEMFHEDALLAAQELDITLTTRDRNKPEGERTPMCGVPYHSVDAYIGRLIAKGHKVAICEQTEDPAQAKGLVDRDVVRIMTPGTVMADTMLEAGRNNFLVSIHLEENGAGLCFGDISTGQISATVLRDKDWKQQVLSELSRFSPKEAILSPTAAQSDGLTDFLHLRLGCRWEPGDPDSYQLSRALTLAQGQFQSGLDQLPADHNAALQAVGGLLHYLYSTQKTDLSHLTTLSYYTGGEYMGLDVTARRNLELTETMRTKEKRGTLLWVLDKTQCAMGGRLLRAWLERPLLSPGVIIKRQDAIEALTQDTVAQQELRYALGQLTDLERLISRVVYGTANGRDLVALSQGLSKVPTIRGLLSGFNGSLLTVLRDSLDDLADLRDTLDRGLVDEPPISVRDGGFIRQGYNQDVDYLHSIMKDGKSVVAALEAKEREVTGIKNLKVGYNKVFGYYMEVSKSNYDLVPDTYIRKQTLANCERFITQELKDMEHTILSAQDKVTALEYQLFCELRDQTAAQVTAIQATAGALAQIDVLTALSQVAVDGQYCKPTVDLSRQLDIMEGRHPVVEKMLKDSLFTPNDTHMDGDSLRTALITGPNMAGKSTYMRQVALIVLMAQIGSFVPAKSAHIGLVDRIFTRVGASDDLAAGQSTFMVEMTEVADLLKNATDQSLLILDEIGRGTSTYDGMAMARAVLEHCNSKKKLGARTLFATHYHELTSLADTLDGVKNYNVVAKKRQNDIVFLRKVVAGAADQSYGIEVAQLAGVPKSVITRAQDVLVELESTGMAPPPPKPAEDDGQLTLGDAQSTALLQKIQALSVETLTPIEAMNLLYTWKQEFGS